MRPAFWATVFRFDRARVAPSVGLRNAAGVAIPIALGLAFHAPGSGLLAATGALNVAFSDSRLPYIQRARRMLAASAVPSPRWLRIEVSVSKSRTMITASWSCSRMWRSAPRRRASTSLSRPSA